MTCDETRAQLSALIDGALAPAERAAADAHLVGCGDCRRELDRLRQTVAQLQALPAPRAPAGFADRVLAATRAPLGAPRAAPAAARARAPWRARVLDVVLAPMRLRVPLQAAAVLLVGVGAVYLFQHTPELQEATRVERLAPVPQSAPPVGTPTPASPAGDVVMKREAPPRAEAPAKAEAPTSTGATAKTGAPAPAAPPEPRENVAAKPDAAPPELSAKRRPKAGLLGERADSSGPPARSGAVPPAAPAAPSERREAPTMQALPEPKLQGRAQSDAAGPQQSQIAQDRAVTAPAPSMAPVPPIAPGPKDGQEAAASADRRGFLEQKVEQTTEQPAGKKTEEAPAAAERQRTRDLAARQAPAAPAPAAPAPAPPASGFGQTAPSARSGPGLAKVAVVPRLIGRLAVTDRAAADRALADLLGRVGGREVLRRVEGVDLIVEVALSAGAYAGFVDGLARIGRWEPDAQLPAGVEPLQIALRLTDPR